MQIMQDAGALRSPSDEIPDEIVTRWEARKHFQTAKDTILRAGRKIDASTIVAKFDGLTLKHWFTGQIRKILILANGEVAMTPVTIPPSKKMKGSVIVRNPLRCLDWISNSSPV